MPNPLPLLRDQGGIAVQTPSGPLPIRTILGIGRNYAEHAREQAAAVPDRPMVFTKNPGSLCLSGDEIVVPQVARDPDHGGNQTDFEAELGVILGRAVRDIPESEALSAVLGYCCANDVSARWWQKQGSGGQFWRGKSFDTFCPLGPAVVPAGAAGAGGIEDPQGLRVRCRVNGETMQDGTTADMIFPVARLIADLSRGMTLEAGTVILTGTPSGVGMARTPPVWLQDGDTVEVEIDGIGTLTNRVRFG
ncbi:MAG: fumarylacetoacetate hydrolase family protein [Phycisphaerales bacterium]|nr:fumarylacetoacetate hydrolase family protein [Planctomycetota bacterium]MCH8508771.1 fumarylacetoacetate hydrolase family protein [Phycisphaerales bacterium]